MLGNVLHRTFRTLQHKNVSQNALLPSYCSVILFQEHAHQCARKLLMLISIRNNASIDVPQKPKIYMHMTLLAIIRLTNVLKSALRHYTGTLLVMYVLIYVPIHITRI